MSNTAIVKNPHQREPGEPPDGKGSTSEQVPGVLVAAGDKAATETVKDTTTPPKVDKPNTLSFKEKLLSMGGGKKVGTEVEDFDMTDEEELPENKWYKFQEEEEKSANASYVYDPCPEIRVSESELEDWSKPWKGALVVSLLGKRVSFRVLENKLKRDWARKGTLQITDMPKNFYVVQFTAVEDYKHALFQGPWMLADHYLLVQRWRPFFITNATVESKVAVWVRIPELPLELYNDRFLWRVGAKLGTLLKIDRVTSIQSRGQFARLCVEIDLSKKLVPNIQVKGVVLKLEYEGLHIVCFACGKYGHKQDSCLELQLVASEGDGNGRGTVEVECKEGNPVSHPMEMTQHGLVADVSLLENVKQGDGKCERKCESDRYNWLTVKKVNRYKEATKANRMVDREQIPKSGMITKDPPTISLSSRFSLLTKGTSKGVGEAEVCEMLISEGGPTEEQSVGPKGFVLGQEEKTKANRVRNKKGGKNPQTHVKGKENKIPSKALGPRMKQFSTKVSRSHLGRVDSLSVGKQNDDQMVWSKPPLQGPKVILDQPTTQKESLNITSSSAAGIKGDAGLKSSFRYVELKNEGPKASEKEKMVWDRVEDLGDSEVLRDLHLGIQNFLPKLDPGEKVSLNATSPLTKEVKGKLGSVKMENLKSLFEGVPGRGIKVSGGPVVAQSQRGEL